MTETTTQQDLKAIYTMDMHSAYEAARVGKFSINAFGRLAAAITVVRSALEASKENSLGAIDTLDSTITTLQAIRQRGDLTNVWGITDSERPAIKAGVNMAEQCLNTLDVNLLGQTALRLLQELTADSAAS